ncbi:hypothetical protein PFISCL1PPCAC_17144, partial [Pristionchus fissidentatus]
EMKEREESLHKSSNSCGAEKETEEPFITHKISKLSINALWHRLEVIINAFFSSLVAIVLGWIDVDANTFSAALFLLLLILAQAAYFTILASLLLFDALIAVFSLSEEQLNAFSK